MPIGASRWCTRTILAYGNRIITIALIQGDALGGGFEFALSCDYIVAEKQAKLGFPEILFNLFPGMGAYTFLSRRVGVAKTEEMLRTGQIYSAEELHALGIVDFLVEEAQGEAKVKELIGEDDATAQRAIFHSPGATPHQSGHVGRIERNCGHLGRSSHSPR